MSSRARIVFAVGALVVLLGAVGLWYRRGDRTGLLRSDDSQFVPGAFERCDLYRRWVMVAEPSFVPFANDFSGLAQVDTSSRAWAAMVFTNAANPYSKSLRVRRSYHEGRVDLLRFEYVLGDVAIEIVESVGFYLVRFVSETPGSLGSTTAARVARISRLIPLVLRTRGTCETWGGPEEYQLVFYYRPPLEPPTLFSTSPQQPVADFSWYRKVDGGIDERGLFLVVYKTEGTQHIAPSLHYGLWFQGKAVQGYGNK